MFVLSPEQERKHHEDSQYADFVIRSTFLDRGRCCREDQPVKAKVSADYILL